MAAFDDMIARASAKVPSASTPLGQSPDNYFTGFLNSAWSALPELVGFDPTREAEKFRATHPVSGFVSQVLPAFIPYGGWFAATERIPALAKGVAKAGELASGGARKAPVLAGFAREAARFAPFEAGRAAVASQVNGGENFYDVAQEGLVNTLASGVVGGIAGAVGAAGRRTIAPELSSEVDQAAPYTLQYRTLEAAQKAGKTKNPEADAYWLRTLKENIYGEYPVSREKYIQPLETGGSENQLGRMFNPMNLSERESANLTRRRFTPEDWKEQGDLTNALNLSGLRDKEAFIRYPRFVEAKTEKGGMIVGRAVLKNLNKVGGDTWMARETDDGLYVMAKRIKIGEQGKGDQWVLWKTDQPDLFAPLAKSWTENLSKVVNWGGPDTMKPIGTEMNDVLQQMMRTRSLHNYRDVQRLGVNGWLGKLREQMGIDKSTVGSSSRIVYDYLKEHVAPTKFQFTFSPRANYILGMWKDLFDYADSVTHGIMYGSQKPGTQALMHNVMAGIRGETTFKGREALDRMVDSLSETDLGDIWRGMNGTWTRERIKEAIIKGEISPTSGNFLNQLTDLSDELITQTQKTQAAFGESVTKAQPGHLMLSHTWEGTLRTPILDSKGNLVTLLGGYNRADLQKQADAIVAAAKKEGKNWKVARDEAGELTAIEADSGVDLERLLKGANGYTLSLGSSDFRLAQSLRERWIRDNYRPAILRIRGGVGGYIGHTAPWNKEQLKQILFKHLHSQQRYIAERNLNNVMGYELQRLADEDPRMYNQLMQRVDDIAGRQGRIPEAINSAVDKLMSPILGKNSATKMIGAVNSLTYHFQLGMGNLMFPVLNATQFLQTALPQAAFILKSPREAIARYYSWDVLAGVDGLPKGSMGTLSAPKLAFQSMREMAKPDDLLKENLGKAAREGVWAPRLAEEFIGENASMITGLKNAGEKGWVNWLKAVSAFLPEASERFSRVHAFTMGHLLGRDFLRLEGDQLYRFSKQFTENTMFGYSTADRARILSGPFGSLFGLFKNWQMHYLGWLTEYTGQAMNGNLSPLLWMLGGTAATGGVAAAPMYGAADALNRLITDKPLMQTIYETFGPDGTSGEHISDGVYFGLPGLLGLSMQASASAPSANPVRDASQLFSFVQYQRMRDIGLAVGQAVDAYSTTGEHPINSASVRDAFAKAFAPRSVFRTLQSMEDGFINSITTGYPLAEATPMQRFWYSMGFNTTDVERQMKVADELWRDNNARRAAVANFGTAWAQAQEARDSNAMRTLMLRAISQGVPIDSMIKSANARLAKQEEDQIERLANQQRLEELSAIYRRR